MPEEIGTYCKVMNEAYKILDSTHTLYDYKHVDEGTIEFVESSLHDSAGRLKDLISELEPEEYNKLRKELLFVSRMSKVEVLNSVANKALQYMPEEVK